MGELLFYLLIIYLDFSGFGAWSFVYLVGGGGGGGGGITLSLGGTGGIPWFLFSFVIEHILRWYSFWLIYIFRMKDQD